MRLGPGSGEGSVTSRGDRSASHWGACAHVHIVPRYLYTQHLVSIYAAPCTCRRQCGPLELWWQCVSCLSCLSLRDWGPMPMVGVMSMADAHGGGDLAFSQNECASQCWHVNMMMASLAAADHHVHHVVLIYNVVAPTAGTDPQMIFTRRSCIQA